MALALELMGNTWQFIFYTIAIVLFLAGGVGLKPGGERVQLIGLGLSAFVLPDFWDHLALAVARSDRSEQLEVAGRAGAELVEVDLDALHAPALGEHAGLRLDPRRDEHRPGSARACRRGRAAPGSAAAARPRRSRRPASPRRRRRGRRRRGTAGRPGRGRSGTRGARAEGRRAAPATRAASSSWSSASTPSFASPGSSPSSNDSSKSTSCSSITSSSPFGLATVIDAVGSRRSCTAGSSS